MHLFDFDLYLNVPTPCITFDQPLWLKAVEIIKAKAMNIVCRLVGFHTLMSFLGSTGSMMKGSGLEEALEKVYGQLNNFREGLCKSIACTFLSRGSISKQVDPTMC